MKLLDYIKGDRRGRDAHRIEMDSMTDPLLHDAVDGFDAVDGDHIASIESLRSRIRSRYAARRPSSRRRVWAGVAAGLAVVGLIGGLYTRVLRSYDAIEMEKLSMGTVEEEIAEITRRDRKPPERAEPVSSVATDAIGIVKDDAGITSGMDFAEFSEEVVAVMEDGVPASARETDTAAAPSAAESMYVGASQATDDRMQPEDTALSSLLAGKVAGVSTGKERRRAARAVDAARQDTGVVKDDARITTEMTFTEFDEDAIVVAPVEVKEEKVDDEPFLVVEQMPSFQGGDLNKFRTWVTDKLVFPQIAIENNISGRVTVTFVVERDGSLTNIQVLQSPDRSLSEETIRVLRTSPKWTPGKQRNQSVRVKYTLPVDFHLDDNAAAEEMSGE